MAGKIMRVNGVGPVLFERSRRARRINISIRPFRGIRVAVPVGVSYGAAKAFVDAKTEWITTHHERIRALERTHRDVAGRFRGICRKEAVRILSRRLRELAEQHGYTYNRLFVRNQKSRWGSCSPKNNISLNMKLVRLPERLMDYIILHELVHTRIKNHGRAFHEELERRVGPCKPLEAELATFSVGLLEP